MPLLILLVFFANPAVFTFFLTLVLFLALLEFNQMGLAAMHRGGQWSVALFGAAVPPVLHAQQYMLILPLLAAAFILLALLFLFQLPPLEALPQRLGWLCLGFFYLPVLFSHLVLLRVLPDGREWIFLTLLAIMGCDTLAYFVGVRFGRRKLYPAVSPNKSIEGGLGGLGGAVLAVLLAKYWLLPQVGLFAAIMIGALLGVAGQLGDLFESLLKRSCGVKDSGTMIPGHGGILDRLDSLLFAFPIVYYVARYGYGG